MRENEERIVEIKQIVKESQDVKTFHFQDSLCEEAVPGQYVMIWLPDIDEIPFSLSKIGKAAAVTVKKVGDATEAFCGMEEGDKVGIRGPFGNGFTIHKGRTLIVGGGTGLCAIRPLIYRLIKNAEVELIMGGNSRKDLLFLEEIKRLLSPVNIEITTEDGSVGKKGLVTDLLQDKLTEKRFDKIYTCGPEAMMRKVFEIAEMENIPMEASIERLIKCGVGLCGSCSFGPYRVCQDGPVFTSSQLREVKAFGKTKRDFTGKKVKF